MSEIDSQLIKETNHIAKYLQEIKNALTLFDKTNNYDMQIKHVRNIFPAFKEILDEHFNKTSRWFDRYDKSSYKTNQDYYINTMWDYLYYPKINKHIYDKPFGYPGDFMLMNYLLDYQDNFIGDSSYERLINYYSVKLPFCLSNVTRRIYIKTIIQYLLDKNPSPSITSVACGSIRELLDLRTGHAKIKEINCIDFEPKVFEYIKNELTTRPFPSDTKINFIQQDLVAMVKTNKIPPFIKSQDFIYFSGIFDYLPDRIAKRVVNGFFPLLKDGGIMLICSCSKQYKQLHSYYEVLGKWKMIYRNEADLDNIISEISPKKYRFDHPVNGECYHFLILEK